MWEFSLACDNKNKDIIEYINNCFCQDLPDCMLTTFTDKHFTYLLFASDERLATICKSKIQQCVITYIIDVYKYEYFTSRIAKNNNQLITQAYIKSLSLYDVSTDIDYLKLRLSLQQEFHIDSFIQFKMNDMLRMWNELCELVTSNINYLNQDMMIDVMRSFIGTFEISTSTLKIIIENDGFVLYKIDENNCLVKLKDNAPAIDVVNYTMFTNPRNIEIYGDIKQNFSMINLLKSLYDDKVVVISK